MVDIFALRISYDLFKMRIKFDGIIYLLEDDQPRTWRLY